MGTPKPSWFIMFIHFPSEIAIFPGHRGPSDLPGSPLESSQHRPTPSCQDLKIQVISRDFSWRYIFGGNPETTRFLKWILKTCSITPDTARASGPRTLCKAFCSPRVEFQSYRRACTWFPAQVVPSGLVRFNLIEPTKNWEVLGMLMGSNENMPPGKLLSKRFEKHHEK